MSRFCAIAMMIGATCLPAPATAQEKPGASESYTAFTYKEFDQTPMSGWRAIAAKGKHLDAARLIDGYIEKRKDLKHRQVNNLRFHSGQLYAFAGKKATAIARLKLALMPKEPVNSPIRWNAYVNATLAFLRGDRKSLEAHRKTIAAGPKLGGKPPNLDVVDRLLNHFGQPYSKAYLAPNKSAR